MLKELLHIGKTTEKYRYVRTYVCILFKNNILNTYLCMHSKNNLARYVSRVFLNIIIK